MQLHKNLIKKGSHVYMYICIIYVFMYIYIYVYICVGSFCKYIIHILKVTLHGTRTMPDSQRYP